MCTKKTALTAAAPHHQESCSGTTFYCQQQRFCNTHRDSFCSLSSFQKLSRWTKLFFNDVWLVKKNSLILIEKKGLLKVATCMSKRRQRPVNVVPKISFLQRISKKGKGSPILKNVSDNRSRIILSTMSISNRFHSFLMCYCNQVNLYLHTKLDDTSLGLKREVIRLGCLKGNVLGCALDM